MMTAEQMEEIETRVKNGYLGFELPPVGVATPFLNQVWDDLHALIFEVKRLKAELAEAKAKLNDPIYLECCEGREKTATALAACVRVLLDVKPQVQGALCRDDLEQAIKQAAACGVTPYETGSLDRR